MKKKALTLLEVTLVFFLVGVVGTVISWNLYQRYKVDYFVSQEQKLNRWVKFLQMVSAIHDVDVICTFAPTPKGWEARAGFVKGKGFSLNKKEHVETFPKIHFYQKEKEKPFTIHFSPKGKVYPEIQLVFYYSDSLQKEIAVSSWSRFEETQTQKDFFPKNVKLHNL